MAGHRLGDHVLQFAQIFALGGNAPLLIGLVPRGNQQARLSTRFDIEGDLGHVKGLPREGGSRKAFAVGKAAGSSGQKLLDHPRRISVWSPEDAVAPCWAMGL